MATTTSIVKRVFDRDFKDLFGVHIQSSEREYSILIEGSDEDEDEVIVVDNPRLKHRMTKRRRHNRHEDCVDVSLEEVIAAEGLRKYYRKALISGCWVSIGDFILMEADDDKVQPYIGKVVSLFEDHDIPMCHVHWMHSSQDTLLEVTGNKNELFFSFDECQDSELSCFLGKAQVTVCAGGNPSCDIMTQEEAPEGSQLYFVEYV